MIIIKGTCIDQTGLALAKWFIDNSKFNILPPFSAMGFLDQNGDLKGVAIFNDFNYSNIEIHLYAPRCICKQTYKAVLDYVFNELKCNRLTAKPYRSNKKLLSLLPRLGFQYQCTLDQYYGPNKSEDALVYRVNKELASKWIEFKDAKRP